MYRNSARVELNPHRHSILVRIGRKLQRLHLFFGNKWKSRYKRCLICRNPISNIDPVVSCMLHSCFEERFNHGNSDQG